MRPICRSPEGQRITVFHLRAAMKASEAMNGLFLKYVQVFLVQTAQTAMAMHGQDRCASGPLAPDGARPGPSQHAAADLMNFYR